MARPSMHRFFLFAVLVFFLGLLARPHAVFADDPVVWKVEEDWELNTFQSDPVIFSPQVTFFSTPDDRDPETYFQLQINYAADDSFSAGGFHVAAYKESTNVDEERSNQQITLSLPSDSLQWTSVMAVVDSQLLFAVKDGVGQEWGGFGGPEYLVRIDGTTASDLDHYSYNNSLANVDIGFGKNRVASIKLNRIRLFYSDGSITTTELAQAP